MKIFIIAGEKSGDMLGAKLVQALRRLSPSIAFMGLGGEAMACEGIVSLFAMEDIAVMGLTAVFSRVRLILRRIEETANAVIAAQPDALVIIDSPDFTHRVARKVRAKAPMIPIVDYVSPSVWAWRPGRARAMRAYVDLVMAVLPFEPEVYVRLQGPPCVFVGHPLVEHLNELQPNAQEAQDRASDPAVLLIMPGSRRSEIERLMPDFGHALHRVAQTGRRIHAILPAVAYLEADIRRELGSWPIKPEIVIGDSAKLAAFRRARMALVASGTATLELALAGVPMVVAYKVSKWEMLLKPFVNVPSMVLTNLILQDNVIPEFLQRRCNPEALASALTPLFVSGMERDRQIAAFARLPKMLHPQDNAAPALAAAKLVLAIAHRT